MHWDRCGKRSDHIIEGFSVFGHLAEKVRGEIVKNGEVALVGHHVLIEIFFFFKQKTAYEIGQ